MNFFLLIYFAIQLCHAVELPIVDQVQKPLDGQICGFGDMNKDRYTDLIVQNQDYFTLTIYLQSESGKFESGSFPPIKFNIPSSAAICSVADFNGDTLPDILVSSDDIHSGKKLSLFLNKEDSFDEVKIDIGALSQPPTVVDINGDGIADIVGFLEKSGFLCLTFNSSAIATHCEDDSFPGHEAIKKPFAKFPHIFSDISGDLSAEIIFALQGDSPKQLVFQAWQLESIKDNV